MDRLNNPTHKLHKDAIVYVWSEMSDEDTTYRLISDITFNSFVFIQIPSGCTIDFQNNYSFHNCVLISNNTRLKGLPTNAHLCKNVKGLNEFEVVNNSAEFEIVGKIYNEQERPITLKGETIERGTKLLYNYIPQVSAKKQYDGLLNNGARRARRLGLFDCLIMVNVSKDQYNNYNQNITPLVNALGENYSQQKKAHLTTIHDYNLQTVADFGHHFDQSSPNVLEKFKYGTANTTFCASITGGWTKQGYINTPKDLVAEMYLNGLCVKGIKFHQGSAYWNGSIQEYCDFILQYMTELKSAIFAFNNPDTNLHPELASRGKIEMLTEVYIANEMPNWTNMHCPEAQALANLAYSLYQLGFQPQISFAHISDMVCCDESLYNYVHPNWNFYTRLTHQKVLESNEVDDVDAYIDSFVEKEFLAENLIERFEALGTFWKGRYRFDNTRQIALSEVGCRPCKKSLRATSNRIPDEIGGFNECVMPIYWKALDKLAQKVRFKYMVVFLHDWIFNDSSVADNNNNDADVVISRRSGAQIEERMYEIFRTFGTAPSNSNS